MTFINLNKIRPAVDFSSALNWLKEANLVQSYSSSISGNGRFLVDSRNIANGDAFIAYCGVSQDGHEYIGSAIKSGSKLIIAENIELLLRDFPNTPYIQVKSSRAAWAWLESHGRGQPQNRLRCIGITGTNGKTSTSWLLTALLEKAGMSPLYIGTLGVKFRNELLPTQHTSPDPDFFFAVLERAVSLGADFLVLEVSSHALSMDKFVPLRFEAAAWTSFSRDHLDFHQTMENYWDAKSTLFSQLLKNSGRAVIHDSVEPLIIPSKIASEDTWLYSSNQNISVNPYKHSCLYETESHSSKLTTVKIQLDGKVIAGQTQLVGQHSSANLACAITIAQKFIHNFEAKQNWLDLPQIPGRLERASNKFVPEVLVDYAHTPDALEKSLGVARSMITAGRLWLVFGCGGNRDRGKRPLMGKLASELADFTIITSDNPRNEEPMQIISEIICGIPSGSSKFSVEPDRERAIFAAIMAAGDSDLILIAGKGHERYQIIGNQSYDFNDCTVARNALVARSNKEDAIQ